MNNVRFISFWYLRFFVFWSSKMTKTIFYVCLLFLKVLILQGKTGKEEISKINGTHRKENPATKVTKIQKKTMLPK